MSDQDSHLPDQLNARVAVRVREEIARRRISRQLLADEARISLSTLEKALSSHRPSRSQPSSGSNRQRVSPCVNRQVKLPHRWP